MGVVWLARDRALDRLVAIKVAAPGAVAEWGARLLREGRVAASLSHPHIVAVFAIGGERSRPFLAMEYVEGGSLEARIRERSLPVREAAKLAERMAGALAFAHQAGVLHRDVKPSNILLDPQGEPHLADFGLAAAVEGSGDLTLPGQVVGTPAYLAPEMLHGSSEASPASDVYGLGAVLYACLTGRAPFIGDSAGAILAQLPAVDPPPPRLLRAGIPRDLETICMKCLEKAPDRRYGSAALLHSDLQAFLSGRPIAARAIGPAGRLARLCRRHPAAALSASFGFVCLLALAIGGPAMALQLARARSESQDRLREALLDRSRATRLAARDGQRTEALASAVEAATIRPGLDARDAAIAALARPELLHVRSWGTNCCEDGVISYEPDSDRYAVETAPGVLELRALGDNHLIQAFEGPREKFCTYPCFSGDGRRLVLRNEKGQVLAWSAGSPRTLWSVDDRPYVLAGRFIGYGQPDAFSPDGLRLASALHGGGVSVVDPDDGHEVGRIATEVEATHVAFSPDGRSLAVGRGLRNREGRVVSFVRVYEAQTLREVCRLSVEKNFQTIAWSPEGNQLLVTGGRLDLFDASSGKMLRSIDDPNSVRSFFGPLGNTLLSTATSGAITLWDLGSGRPLLTGTPGSGAQTQVSKSGDQIVTLHGASRAEVLRLEMSGVERTLAASGSRERENVLSAAVPVIDGSPDGRWLATALWGSVQLRDAAGTLLASIRLGSPTNYCSVRFSRDGHSLLVGTAEEGLLRVPILVTAGPGAKLGTPQLIDSEHPEFIADVSHDGRRALVTSLISGFVKVVPTDGSKGAARWALPGAAGAAFVDHDAHVLANSLDGQSGAKLEVRDAADGVSVVRTLPYPRGAHVNVSADGSLIVVGCGEDGTVVLRADGRRGARLPPQVQGRGVQCAISPDGRTLAFGQGTTVWLVDASSGLVLAHLVGAQAGGYAPGLTYSADGNRVAVLWDDGQLSIWDLQKLKSELSPAGLAW